MMETINGLSDFTGCPTKMPLNEKLNTSLRGIFWGTPGMVHDILRKVSLKRKTLIRIKIKK